VDEQADLKIGGVEVNYYFVCKRKLWLFMHQIAMESSSDKVALGKLVHEHSFEREKKEMMIFLELV